MTTLPVLCSRPSSAVRANARDAAVSLDAKVMHDDDDNDCPPHGDLVTEANRIDLQGYDRARALFWARVGAMANVTGFKHHER